MPSPIAQAPPPLERVTIQFRGHSDDTAGCYWGENDIDHDDCARGRVRVFHLRHETGTLAVQQILVTMQYGNHSMWCVGIGPLNDDDELPPWPMRWSFQGYSALLAIDVPRGTRIGLLPPGPNTMALGQPSEWTVIGA